MYNIFKDDITTDKSKQKKRKSKEEEILDCATSITSHKCNDRCKIKKEVVDLSIGTDDPIVKKSTDIKCKKDKKQRNAKPEFSAIFFNNNHNDPPEDSYNFAKDVIVKIGDEQICSFKTFVDIMVFESKYLICEGAHKALEEILDDLNLSSIESKETNIFPVFERLMKEHSRIFMTDLLKTAVLITKN